MSYKTLHTGKKIQSFDLSNEFKNRFKKKNPFRYLSTESILEVKRNVKGEGLELRT